MKKTFIAFLIVIPMIISSAYGAVDMSGLADGISGEHELLRSLDFKNTVNVREVGNDEAASYADGLSEIIG
ncbi:MAG TPA: hypothetical protein PLN69_01215, partial [bacterium]|nr:hypothetical protein [bacterium]